jgi:hypothetical protein
MAIQVNGEILNLTEPSTVLEKEVASKLEKIYNRTKPLELYRHREIEFDDRGLPTRPAALAFKLSAAKIEGGVRQKWNIVGDEPITRHDKDVYKPKLFHLETSKPLDPQLDTETIFFLTEIIDINSRGLYVYDEEQVALSYTQEIEEKNDAEFMIFNKRSPLSESDLRVIALSMGIDSGDDVHINIVKKRIWEAVESDVKKQVKGYKQYTDQWDEMGEDIKLDAYIHKALSLEAIEINRGKWVYADSNEVICVLPTYKRDRPNIALREYLLKNEADRNLFVSALEGQVDDVAYSLKDLDAMTVPKLKSVIKELTGGELTFSPKATKEEVLTAYQEWSNK